MAEETKPAADNPVPTGEIEEGKIFAVIGYIGILCLLPLLLKKENKFALFHGKQGLVLFIAEIVTSVVVWVPILGWIVALLASLAFIVLSVMGILQALSGNYWKAPVVGDLAEKINL